MFKKPLKSLNFYENVTDPKFALLVQFGTPTTAWRWTKSKKSKYLPRKTLIIELLKYTKIKALSSLSFPEKAQLLVRLFELFLVGNWGWSHFQESIKFWHFTYFINMISGRFNVKAKKKKKNTALLSFAAMGGKWHFRKILTQFFEFDCCFRYHALMFEKKKLNFMAPEFNAESIGTNSKCQKSKTKKLIRSLCTGKYIAISSLTRQWHH